LSKVNAEWKAKVGEGTAVNWPLGAGGKGNEGVSAFVSRLPNSLGYVEYSYAKQNKLSYALMQNASGAFVRPEDDTFKAAAAGADWNKTFYQVLTNQLGKDAWPITGATFILMHTKQDKPANATEVLKFFNWTYKNGEKVRSFFTSKIGSHFAFNVIFIKWMKENVGKNIGDAITEWNRIYDMKNAENYVSEIDPQFEYNRYMRAFLKDNPELPCKDAMKYWKLKRLQRGTNKYNRKDLELK
jgi:hypothetical protein